MSACNCVGCGGHVQWLAEKRRQEAERLAENTKRFEAWLETPEGKAALGRNKVLTTA